jgi:galactokinase
MGTGAGPDAAESLEDPGERNAFLHVTTEALRVRQAVCAMERANAAEFGRLLLESHASLRDRLLVSCDGLDRLVEAAMAGGALGARLTGAGFGGCAVVFCQHGDRAEVRRSLVERYYSSRPEFEAGRHLLEAEPSSGVLCPDKT